MCDNVTKNPVLVFSEVQGDLLSAPRGWALVHCISADYALGAGVAKQIDERYGMKEKLRKTYGAWDYELMGPAALPVLDVYNLITKEKCYEKPTLKTLEEALIDLRKCIEEYGIDKLAMPRIGCGLDRLNWEEVRQLILDVFHDTRVTILVYTL